jgi:DNA-3-methyladenine glycosylase II
LAIVINRYGDLVYSLHSDECSFFIETIIGQMLSNKAADAIAARLCSLCGGQLSISAISNLEQAAIKGVGLSDQKAAYIKGFVSLIKDVPDFFTVLGRLEDEEILRKLTSIRGIGMWSAKMYLIFVLNRIDVLPFEDGAFLQTYRWLYGTDDVKKASIIDNCRPWKPFSSLAARYLYRALDCGLTRDAEIQKELDALGNIKQI